MIRQLFYISFFLFSLEVSGQASLASIGTPYAQNFNSLPNTTDGAVMATWTNNTTLAGWYVLENSTAIAQPYIEASCGPLSSNVNNTGHCYIIASGADRNLGARPSGTTGTIYYGVRLKNNTGVALTSVYVDYFGEQWSIAENGSNVNQIAVDYQVGATVTSLTAGAWTNVPGLTFTQIYSSSQSSGLGGTACGGTSAQCLALNGNLAANRTEIQACITVAVPAGDEIMLRWADINDPSNDHHLQIDDVNIYPYDISCATILPIELLNFSAKQEDDIVRLDWATASETNNDFFTIERATDVDYDGFHAIGTVNGNATTTFLHEYHSIDPSPAKGNNYYRLRQTDFNGTTTVSNTIVVNRNQTMHEYSAKANRCDDGICYSLNGWNSEVEMKVYDLMGRLLYEKQLLPDESGNIPLDENESGMLIVTFVSDEHTAAIKVMQ